MPKLCKPIALLIAGLLLFSMISCREMPDTEASNENYTSAGLRFPIRNYSLAYGKYIYRAGNYGIGLQRYDRTMGEITTACITPDCDGNCYVERMALDLAGITESKLVFSTYPNNGDFWGYVSYDLLTGAEKLLATFTHSENYGQAPVLYEGYAYYLKNVLREGGNPENSDDYDPSIFRISVHGGEEERVLGLESVIVPVFIIDGVLYGQTGDHICKIELSTGEYIKAIDIATEGYTGLELKCYYDGFIYYSYSVGDHITDEYGTTHMETHIGRWNLVTGEKAEIAEYRGEFLVTEQGIYYGKVQEPVYLYIPPEDKQDEEKATCNTMPTLSFCEHDGSNAKDVFNEETLNYSIYEVVGDTAYIWGKKYDEATHSWGSGAFYAVDLKDGSYTKSEYEKG